MKEPAARSLEYWARTNGERPALYEQGGMLNFADWNEYADLLADGFASRGLGPGDVIAVRCCNRIEWAVIALAAAKIDAPLLTLDPDLPGRALRERLIATQASAIILGDTDPAAVSPALFGLSFRLRASMDAARPGFFNFWDLFPPAAPARFGWSRPSLIAWSAGTKGRARRVGIPRQRTAPASISLPPPIEKETTLITVPFHRAWGTTQFWGALAAGHAIALVRAFDPAQVLGVITRRRVTRWAAWPEMLERMALLPVEMLRAADLSSLRELMIGGAASPAALKDRLREVFGPILSEAYGSTEAGLVALMPAERQRERPHSCGLPIRGAAVQIRDAEGRPLPVDVTGEIWARTPRTLACELPDLASRSRRDADGFIATGDAGRVDADGFIYVSGRAQDLPGWGFRRAG